MQIIETMNTSVNFRKWLQGNGLEASYSFAMAKTPTGLRAAPPDIPLDGKTSEEKRNEIKEEFGFSPPNLSGLQFVVEFSNFDLGEPLLINNVELDTKRVVAMHFSRTECKLEYQPISKRFYWRSITDRSDRDEGDLSTKEALVVFAGVVQVAVKYYDNHKPDGIIAGVRDDAKESRGRIYRKIAERLAAERGATVATIGSGFRAPIIVWFPNNPQLAASLRTTIKPFNPY